MKVDEKPLWEKGALGYSSPQQLVQALLYLKGVYFGIRVELNATILQLINFLSKTTMDRCVWSTERRQNISKWPERQES